MTNMFIKGIGAYVPSKFMLVSDAIKSGHYDPDIAKSNGYTRITIEDKLYPAEMALKASEAALMSANTTGTDISLLSYSSIHRHGHSRLWSPASWLQLKLHAPQAIPINLQIGCNGGFTTMKLFEKLSDSPEEHQSLFISSDSFSNSGFNRWNSDYGLVYGDASVATVTSTKMGFAKVLNFEFSSIPELESMHRLDQASPECNESYISEYDIKATKKNFLASYDKGGFTKPIEKKLNLMLEELIDNFDLDTKPVEWLVTPFLGNKIRESVYDKIFAPYALNTSWDFGKTIGHTGTGDALLGLWKLHSNNLLISGQRVLLISAGAGFTCSAMLLEII